MKEARDFFDQYKNGILSGIMTFAVGVIEKYDPAGRADVSILPDYDLLNGIPISTIQTEDYFIRVPYKKGDLVAVGFACRDIESVMNEDYENVSDRMLDINDAIVLGGLNLFSEPLPPDHSEDLVIAKKDMTTKIVLSKNGDVTIDTPGKIYLGDGAGEGVPLGDQLKTWLDNHTHEYDDDNGNGVSTKTTKKPSGASPDPSKGVFVK